MDTFKDLLHFILAKTDWMKTVVGVSTVLIFSYMVYGIFHYELNDAQETIIVHVLGIIEGMWLMIGSYYFGSSKGSQEKTEIIKKQNEAATDIALSKSENP